MPLCGFKCSGMSSVSAGLMLSLTAEARICFPHTAQLCVAKKNAFSGVKHARHTGVFCSQSAVLRSCLGSCQSMQRVSTKKSAGGQSVGILWEILEAMVKPSLWSPQRKAATAVLLPACLQLLPPCIQMPLPSRPQPPRMPKVVSPESLAPPPTTPPPGPARCFVGEAWPVSISIRTGPSRDVVGGGLDIAVRALAAPLQAADVGILYVDEQVRVGASAARSKRT